MYLWYSWRQDNKRWIVLFVTSLCSTSKAWTKNVKKSKVHGQLNRYSSSPTKKPSSISVNLWMILQTSGNYHKKPKVWEQILSLGEESQVCWKEVFAYQKAWKRYSYKIIREIIPFNINVWIRYEHEEESTPCKPRNEPRPLVCNADELSHQPLNGC